MPGHRDPRSGFGAAGEHYIRVSAFGHRENILKAVQASRTISYCEKERRNE
jgi:aspartate/methionine/tyrosine aminotransferase